MPDRQYLTPILRSEVAVRFLSTPSRGNICSTVNGSTGAPLLDEPRMGLAAGGRITQKIYKDNRAISLYDVEAAERLCIHTFLRSLE